MKDVFIALFAIALVGGIIYLSLYQWRDCLEENSFFTCMRMLSK